MIKRKMSFDNGTYIDGKKRIVYLVDTNNDTVLYSQDPYKGKSKNNKSFRQW